MVPEANDHADYHDVFPRIAGPPRLEAGEGAKAFTEQEPLVTVTLDAGAYRWLWEMSEAEGKKRFGSRNSLASAAATLRAVKALRSAWWKAYGIDEPEVPAPVEVKPMRARLPGVRTR